MPVMLAGEASSADLPSIADSLFAIAIGPAFLVYWVLFVVCPRCTYEFVPGGLRITCRVLRWIKVGTHVIAVADMQEARREGMWPPRGMPAVLWCGTWFALRGVMLVLKRRVRLRKAIYMTPADPDAFVAKVNKMIEDDRGRVASGQGSRATQ